jgi:hypothetical protein
MQSNYVSLFQRISKCFFDHVTLSNVNFVLLCAVAFMNISQHFEACNYFYSIVVGAIWSQISADSHLLPVPGILGIFCCKLAILLHPLIISYIFICFQHSFNSPLLLLHISINSKYEYSNVDYT